MYRLVPHSLAALAALLVWACLLAQTPPAVELRNLGLAQLENERPAEAEATFRRLLQIETGDPLPLASLAIALLRQQKTDEALELIDLALRKAPERGDLLAIKGEILAWTGEAEAALEVLESAARFAPTDPEILYTLYRHATTLRSDAAPAAAAPALRRGSRCCSTRSSAPTTPSASSTRPRGRHAAGRSSSRPPTGTSRTPTAPRGRRPTPGTGASGAAISSSCCSSRRASRSSGSGACAATPRVGERRWSRSCGHAPML